MPAPLVTAPLSVMLDVPVSVRASVPPCWLRLKVAPLKVSAADPPVAIRLIALSFAAAERPVKV